MRPKDGRLNMDEPQIKRYLHFTIPLHTFLFSPVTLKEGVKWTDFFELPNPYQAQFVPLKESKPFPFTYKAQCWLQILL